MTEDFYKVLGITPSADPDAVRAAYHQQMTLYHPDKVAALGDELKKVAEARSKAINTAYTVLRDPTSRQLYDRQRPSNPDSLAPPPPEPSPHPTPPQHSSPRQPLPPQRRRLGTLGIPTLGVVAFFVLVGLAQLAANLAGAPELNVQIVLIFVLGYCFTWFASMLAKARRWRASGFGMRLGSFGIRTLLILLSIFFVFFARALWDRPQIRDHEISNVAEGVMLGLSLLLLMQALAPGTFYRVLGWLKPWR